MNETTGQTNTEVRFWERGGHVRDMNKVSLFSPFSPNIIGYFSPICTNTHHHHLLR